MLAVESKITPAQPVAPTPIGTSSWKQIVEPVEPFLDAVTKRLAEQVNAFDPALSQYAEYALTGNGKHLRPTLVALAANSLGKVNDSHVTVAAIIEMVHLATLVHDDVMDEAEMRRNKLTLAANWGNEIAVLFGDCLFAQALKLAASFPTPEISRAVASTFQRLNRRAALYSLSPDCSPKVSSARNTCGVERYTPVQGHELQVIAATRFSAY